MPRLDLVVNMGVVDVHGNVNLDATKRIHNLFECVEVDFRIVGNGNTGKLGNNLDGARRTIEGVCGVDFLRTVRAHVGLKVSSDRDHGDGFVLRVDTCEDHRVGAVAAPFARAFTRL